MALNDGAFEGNGSVARLLTQMILTSSSLAPALPSLAESLATMFGYSMLQAAQDSPVVDFWASASETVAAAHSAD